MKEEDRQGELFARMHESGCFFFCPRCGLSFPHPPWLFHHRYPVGYGYCGYCHKYVPIEGAATRSAW